ncbi:Casein kinase II subunit alpha' [Lithohypha guttulata]|uniref:Casein kinase II subunit alpha n=1 Tax=Lithohypha guttulata TaxID=1690604 RepID=A0AAN7QPK3_9EURO|nr:Casein kinase II subunit alpha' [Lithohypha guttulata]
MIALRFRTKLVSVGIVVLVASLQWSISSDRAALAKARPYWNEAFFDAYDAIETQQLSISSSSPNDIAESLNIDDAIGVASDVYAAPVVDGESDIEDADSDLDSYEISWGEGEYAEVFKATDLRNNQICVIKVLKPVSMRAVKREIKILQHLSGGPNIVQYVDAATDSTGNSTVIVTEHVNNTYYRTLYSAFNDTEVRFYTFQLLRAIEHAHSRNIMHRDIKPHNLLIEHENRKLRLIDWGLSDYYDEDYAYTTSVGSRFWRAPEILVDYEWYDLSSDMWSFGCMLAALVFASEPFFYGRYNDVNQLIKIAEVLGTRDLFDWLDEYEIILPDTFSNVTSWYERKSWPEFVNERNRQRVNDDVFDLLSKILIYDHKKRLSARDALSHPYFDPVREEALAHANSVTKWLV